MQILIGIGWALLILFAIVGVVVSGVLAYEYLEDRWNDRTTACSRCSVRGLWQKHFCGTCSEKIEKLIGEKW